MAEISTRGKKRVNVKVCGEVPSVHHNMFNATTIFVLCEFNEKKKKTTWTNSEI